MSPGRKLLFALGSGGVVALTAVPTIQGSDPPKPQEQAVHAVRPESRDCNQEPVGEFRAVDSETFGLERARAYFDLRANAVQMLKAACSRGPDARGEIQANVALVHHHLDRLLAVRPTGYGSRPARKSSGESTVTTTQGFIGPATELTTGTKERQLTTAGAVDNAIASQGFNRLPPPIGEAPAPPPNALGPVGLHELARSSRKRASARLQVAHALVRELGDVVKNDPSSTWQESFASILPSLDSALRRVEPKHPR